ncbi:MAG: hypothetical protein ABIR52_01075 [Casimicrobiaceae bacterium]
MIDLGLFRRWPPNLLKVRGFEDAVATADAPWSLEQVRCVSAPDESPEAAPAAADAIQ